MSKTPRGPKELSLEATSLQPLPYPVNSPASQSMYKVIFVMGMMYM